ncbi:MAG TPA: glycoside hydrolase family 32 protein [Bryobacteraceae bacterium]|nr:glycoside hydrolase family 32 protein [Bryobacteraceae bacterium]
MRVLAVIALAALASAAVTEIPRAYDQPYRPQFHFSPREHWTNDPNGLVYFEGEYHLFYQFNPFGDEWGHMSWGHAVSTDLVHWTQLPVALKEENGIMIFTGSAVVDEHNSSGFCMNNKPCLVAVYTGYTPAQGSKKSLQTQNLAYSNDRGRTWTKYSGNPILDLHMTDFRDPKVFWFEKTKRWIMGVSLPDDHKIRFYESTNLKNWTQTSDFGPAGATGGQWECPELFQLPVKGEGAGSRWVLKVGLNPGARLGGSGEQYFVGDFDGKQFKNENPPSLTLWTDYGKDCYCALTFNHLPQTHAAVMIGWMDNWQYAAKLPTSPWRGQMTIPRKLWLRNTAEGIRLFQEPVDELRGLRAGKQLSGPAKTHTFEIVSSMKMGTAQQVGWKILEGNGVSTIVGYDRKKHVVFIDRTRSGAVAFSPDFPSRMEAPLKASSVLHLRIVVDRSSVEVFAEDGRVAMTSLVFPPANANGVEAYGLDGNAGAVEVTIWQLRSIHE